MCVRMRSIIRVLSHGVYCVQRVFCSAARPMPFRATRRPQLIGGVYYHASFLFARCLENGCLFLFMQCCVDVRSSWRT